MAFFGQTEHKTFESAMRTVVHAVLHGHRVDGLEQGRVTDECGPTASIFAWSSLFPGGSGGSSFLSEVLSTFELALKDLPNAAADPSIPPSGEPCPPYPSTNTNQCICMHKQSEHEVYTHRKNRACMRVKWANELAAIFGCGV